MTAAEILADLELKNPAIVVGGAIYKPGDSEYEAILEDRVTQLQADFAAAAATSTRKTWPSVQEFLQEFTLPELAAVWSSEIPAIGALAILLLGWRADVWSDHPLIVQGMAALQGAGILTPERAAAILTPP
jgi:hypothetical protein